ncbi:hypothetical protein MPSEU_000905200 [Mayamaea pseudoterrestris]|nr:hypothetical protein MPSEU_000905200 [Mayamaea pseudoterrestris]
MPDDAALEEMDMGYEEMAPPTRRGSISRRGSMSQTEQRERRASIKAIMSDVQLTPMEKRLSIQHLMDGRRASLSNGGASVHSYQSGVTSAQSSVSGGESTRSYGSNPYGYGDESPPTNVYGYGEDDGLEQFDGDNHMADDGFTICNEQTRRTEITRPYCSHYERQCTIISPCCGMAFGCRICHDDCPNLPPKINNGGRRFHRSASLPSSFTTMHQVQQQEDTHHEIDRFAIREVICRECFTRQSSKTNQCVSCGTPFGAYHCNVCNLWMSDEEAPYHCADCGFCRVGGAHNFQHCHECGMCIDKTLYDNHNCKAGKYRSNCPVCQEYLFSSRSASHEMPCGHAIHWDCFRQLAAHDSRCPVCKKTAETRERMLPTWSAMAAGVALQPVPPELCRVVNITCNDCEQQERNRAWHFLGVQCNNCQSFNTVVDQMVLSGEEAHEFLENQKKIDEAHRNGPPRRRMNRRRSAM